MSDTTTTRAVITITSQGVLKACKIYSPASFQQLRCMTSEAVIHVMGLKFMDEMNKIGVSGVTFEEKITHARILVPNRHLKDVVQYFDEAGVL